MCIPRLVDANDTAALADAKATFENLRKVQSMVFKGDAVVIANLSRFTEFDLNPETTPRLVKRVARYAA